MRARTDKKGHQVKALECDGFDQNLPFGRNPKCKGDVARREKVAASFGVPYKTHAMLCEAHRDALGFRDE